MDTLTELREIVETFDATLPHASNLKTKINLANASTKKNLAAFEILVPVYKDLNQLLCSKKYSRDLWLTETLKATDDYMTLLTTESVRVFSHQSDFRSTVIPELLKVMFRKEIHYVGASGFTAETQKDLIIECVFSCKNNGSFISKAKRVDVALGLSSSFHVNKKKLQGFLVPIIAVEVKTNLDKNMISGIEHSVERLKHTFPECIYFVVTEFADFAIESQNYATTAIDEIFVLRKQKRSNYRKVNNALPLDVDLLKEIRNKTYERLINASVDVSALSKRMTSGKLIGKP
tara:strand:+ start:2140 stop:3009 length:870 start_codon:yes stop_codon:yes gene_type:complete